MGQLIVRQIDEDTKLRLKQRAARHGVSMEEEVRTILRSTLLADEERDQGLGSEIAALFQEVKGWDGILPQVPDEPLAPVQFDE